MFPRQNKGFARSRVCLRNLQKNHVSGSLAMPKNQRNAPQIPFDVEVEFGGKTFVGTYTIGGRPPIVSVSSAYGSKSTQQGASPAESIARRLLHELVADFRRPGTQ